MGQRDWCTRCRYREDTRVGKHTGPPRDRKVHALLDNCIAWVSAPKISGEQLHGLAPLPVLAPVLVALRSRPQCVIEQLAFAVLVL